jgi:hypothetical protein
MNGIHEVTGSIPVWSTNSNLLIHGHLRSDRNLWSFSLGAMLSDPSREFIL